MMRNEPDSNGSPKISTATAPPSYATPRTPERYSEGPIYARVIRETTGRTLTPSQRLVLDVGTERVDGPGSAFAYDQVVAVVGRRSGKTTGALACSLARAEQGPVTLPGGRRVPFRAAHTAQNLIAARKRFLEDVVEPYRMSIPRELWAPAHNIFRNLANTTLSVDPYGGDYRQPMASHIQVYAPTKSAIRGDGLLHLTLDEAMAMSVDDGRGLMAAARPTMSEFRGHAQMWITSNVTTETDQSRWLTVLRDQGREAVHTGRRDGVAYFEWSMDPNGDPADERLWWAHLPALAEGIVDIRELRRDLEELGPAAFGAEYLGLWPGGGAVKAWATIPRTVWTAAETLEEIPQGVPYAVGADIDPFGRAASIYVCADVPGRGLIMEMIAHGEGSTWVPGILERLAPSSAAVVVDDYGPGRDLLMTLEGSGMPLVPLNTRDVAAACYGFESAIGSGSVLHRPSEETDLAVSASLRTPGRAWVYERRIDTVQTPLMAAVLALWGMNRKPPAIPAPAIY